MRRRRRSAPAPLGPETMTIAALEEAVEGLTEGQCRTALRSLVNLAMISSETQRYLSRVVAGARAAQETQQQGGPAVTDRHSGYIVVLEADIREDDAEAVIAALRMVKGVLSVEPITADYTRHIAEQRVDLRWRRALLGLLDHGHGKDGE